MTIVEFLNELNSPITKFQNKRLDYALTDGYHVVIFDVDAKKTVYKTNIHTILHELMDAHGLENQSP